MTNYTKWKNWDAEEFGLTSKENSLYYKKLFLKYLSDTKNLLEIGYGNGSFLNWCKQKHLNVSGIEQDNTLLKRAKNKGYKVYKSIAQLKGVKFDLIVLFDALEHIPQKNIQIVKISNSTYSSNFTGNNRKNYSICFLTPSKGDFICKFIMHTLTQ